MEDGRLLINNGCQLEVLDIILMNGFALSIMAKDWQSFSCF